MNPQIQQWFDDRNVYYTDQGYQALQALFSAAEQPVDWAYEVWDKLAAELTQGDNHQRAFSAQMLARLALSDPEGRLNALFPTLFAVCRDERTVTARHSIQSMWRVGVASKALRDRLLEAFAVLFHEVKTIKQGSIYRPDIVAGLSTLFTVTGDQAVKTCADGLIASETDEKLRKKLQAAWRKPSG